MKNLAKVLAIILTVGTTSVFANGLTGDKGKTPTSSEQKVNVSLSPYSNNKGLTLDAVNEANQKVTVVIYDTYGETVFTETVSSSPDIHRSYNLAALPSGAYSVSVVGDNYTVNKNFDIR